MKISVNWMQQVAGEVQLMPNGIDELVSKIGAQLGAVEEVISLRQKYQGIVIVRVVKCDRHPNADKLSVCVIDDGGSAADVKRDEGGMVQVVCGAPNVRAGMLAAWLPPGSTVPATYGKEPFVLTAREIRGVVSNGMLASAHELGISDNHSGIAEIEQPAKPGDDFAEIYGLDDYIIDIENKMFTHRPDCFGQLGIAREIAGIEGRNFISPDWYLTGKSIVSGSSQAIKGYAVENRVPDLCPRYMMVAMEGIKVQTSPLWLQSYLSRVGIRPINNIVDMTNYIMMLTGQPLHAFDYDKIAINGQAEIIVRRPDTNEKFTLLDGKTIEPRSDAVLICNPKGPIAVGGVMGGNNSEIDENTTRILIECANFDMYNIRKTAMEHGLFTDAVTRFNKGQSSWQCPPVLYKAVAMVQELLPEAKPVGSPVDMHQPKQKNQIIKVSAEFINQRLGLKLTVDEMASLLNNVEFIVHTQPDELAVEAPFWRTDIEIPEDLVEEIGRLYGYDHLPLEVPLRRISPPDKNVGLELKQRVRETLARAGANEVLNYSFVHGNLFTKAGQNNELAYKLSNALSPELQYYRITLTPSLLEKVHANIKAGYDYFALFEIGRTHIKGVSDPLESSLPKEDSRVALVVAAGDKSAPGSAAYYSVRKFLEQLNPGLINRLVPLAGYDFGSDEWGKQLAAPYQTERSAAIIMEGKVLGVAGEFRQSVTSALKLPRYSAGFEVAIDTLHSDRIRPYVPLPKFPKVQQDITIKVKSHIAYKEVYDVLCQELTGIDSLHASLVPTDIYQSNEDQAYKNLTFRYAVAHYHKTLTSEEVNAMLDSAAAAAKDKLGAERV